MNNTHSLKIGTAVLSIWSVLNALPGLGSVAYILLGHHAPAFMYLFTPVEIGTLDSRVLATTDGVALLLNTLIVSFCILSFFVIRFLFAQPSKKIFWALLVSILIAQIAAFAADSYFGNQNILANIFSTLLLCIGFSFAAQGIFKPVINK
jgi:hypothetical protein